MVNDFDAFKVAKTGLTVLFVHKICAFHNIQNNTIKAVFIIVSISQIRRVRNRKGN